MTNKMPKEIIIKRLKNKITATKDGIDFKGHIEAKRLITDKEFEELQFNLGKFMYQTQKKYDLQPKRYA